MAKKIIRNIGNGDVVIKSGNTEIMTVSGTTGVITTTTQVSGPGTVPIGTIIAWAPGHFVNGTNGTYTDRSADFPLTSEWKVCDGSQVNGETSGIFSGTGSGKYLPKLNDSRFLMGSTAAGTTAGQNSVTLAANNIPSLSGASAGTTNIAHNHAASSVTGTVGGSDGTHSHDLRTARDSYANPISGDGGSSRPGYYINMDGANAGGYALSATSAGSGHGHAFTSGSAAGQTQATSNIALASGTSTYTNASPTAVATLPQYLSVKYIMRIK